MQHKRLTWILPALFLSLVFSGCGGQSEYLLEQYRTLVAPPAQTVAAQGGRIAQTQGAMLLQTAQVKLATESANLRETAKVEAATAAASLIDTAQAKLVTQSAGQVTAGPTQFSNLKQTAQTVLETQAAIRLPQLETEAAKLKATSAERLDDEAAKRFPLTLTQAAIFNQTVQAGALQVTQIPPAMRTQAINLGLTAQAGLATQVALLQVTPTPLSLAPQQNSALIVYLVREGDVLSSVANQFGIPVEKIILLNQLRYPWLEDLPQDLEPGMSLIVGIIPEVNQAPVVPFTLPGWSKTPGCDVSKVDWLASPISCQPATIDIVSKIDMTLGCVSLDNPLGYTLTHETLSGWMLTGADLTAGYGWFVDLDRGAVIVGPAIVTNKSSYTECRTPGK
jgi:hypothetical protein